MGHREQLASDPLTANLVTHQSGDLSRQLAVGTVDDHCLPIEVEYYYPSARFRHANHFVKSALGLVQVHQNAFSPTCIKRGICELEVAGVANSELERRVEAVRPSARLGDHCLALVY